MATKDSRVVERSVLIPTSEYEEEPIEVGNHYLHFGLPGALITKSRNEAAGIPCIVVDVGSHYEVHKIRRQNGNER